jgi:phospholipase/carboxylesterase
MQHSTTSIAGLQCTQVAQPPLNDQYSAAVILCHGFGAPGTDLVPVAGEMLAMSPHLESAVFLFPQAPIDLDPFFDARAWWMIDVERIQQLMAIGEFRELRNSNPPQLDACRKLIDEIVAVVMDQHGLSFGQIVLGGFSQGAMLATEVALKSSGQFGGLVVWSGSLINEAVWRKAASERASMRIVQSHGRSDPILPFAGGELLRDMFREFGHEVEFIAFDGPHTISATALHAASRLITQVVMKR